MRDNEQNQSEVAYSNSAKEKRTSMPSSKQFGRNKMPQDSKSVTKKEVKKMMRETEKKDMKEDKKLMKHHVDTMHKRHKEHR